jgi:hypothetical protein
MPRIETGSKANNSRWGFNTIPPEAARMSIAAPTSANLSSAGTRPILVYQLIMAVAAQASTRSPAPDQRVLINITSGGFGGGLYQTGASGSLPTSPVNTSTIFGEVALSVGTPIINANSGNFIMKARAILGNGNLTNNLIESGTNTDDLRVNNNSPSSNNNPWFAYRYAMVPAQVGAPSVSFSGSTASVSWTAPDNGEAVIGAYTVEYASNSSFSGSSSTATGSTSVSISSLSAGTWWFRVYATNVVGTSTPSGSTSAVSPQPLAVWSTGTFTENARVGTAYSKQLTATGIRSTNPYSLASGSLPPGITLNASTGLLSGTATAGATQNFTFTVNAANSDGATTASPSFTIQRVQPLPVWSDETLGRPRVGTAYNDQVVATNAAATNAYSATGLPANGLSLNANTGAITGTPTSTSSFSFTITAKNSDNQTIQKSFTLTPNARLAVWSDQIITAPTIRVNQPYTDGVAANNAVGYALQTPDTLPPGITLNTGTGAITGTPTTPGTYNFRVVASNASTPAETITTGQLTILVEPAAGGAVWNGTAWVPSVFKVWNGATWVETPVKIWNGATWADPIS